ncbi:MAG: NADH-quinone oxidoreductase subunit A, partial [Ignavibacteria bacterium]|nr:NADH-quinone oxidoreductase subunit A [Ignavibacteria bacterium]
MLEGYIPVLIMMVGAVAFAVLNVTVSKILGPRKPNPEKLSTYESGVEPVGSAHSRFSVKYYMAAMLFIIFDIEVVSYDFESLDNETQEYLTKYARTPAERQSAIEN